MALPGELGLSHAADLRFLEEHQGEEARTRKQYHSYSSSSYSFSSTSCSQVDRVRGYTSGGLVIDTNPLEKSGAVYHTGRNVIWPSNSLRTIRMEEEESYTARSLP
ncbi:hypothetical protein GUITHDRAFT_151925 [Guillardia theta CCMP2712]|uniref:Uncharacterized protein n=2 Tax=Guillardia theta TaxID=55529 RepID=L1JIX3_GUITC|nr:hypothetical protein GUITHDRAFT_151925 [Guillardia theta CCMP2712]EKX48104.1 hypothetical protein GUITHDRAFT_151925 [Guillardia theta CCMP2712]|eukprot:XP_005835084.1 hypothetical protein GUITHDRAFT_151925 [Guillardia theta CCMP2712]